MQQLTILGSTGSIGTQTLDVVRRNPDRYRAASAFSDSFGHLPPKPAAFFAISARRDGWSGTIREDALHLEIVECRQRLQILGERRTQIHTSLFQT